MCIRDRADPWDDYRDCCLALCSTAGRNQLKTDDEDAEANIDTGIGLDGGPIARALDAELEYDESLTQRTWQQHHLVFTPGSDWQIAYSYNKDACPNINPRSGRPGDGEWICLSHSIARSHPWLACATLVRTRA